MNSRISSPQFQLSASIYDAKHQEIIGDITADKVDDDHYPTNRFHFYCSDCLEHSDFTRLVHIKEADRGSRFGLTPPKFDLYGKIHSTHTCQHPVRFKELAALAERYEARILEDHSYAFPVTMGGVTRPHGVTEGLNTAKRLGKVLYAVMYDEELRDRQFFEINGDVVSLTDLFAGQTVQGTQNQHQFLASIFSPLGRADFRGEYAHKSEIQGVSHDSEISSPVLSCASWELYRDTKAKVERWGGNKSAPVVVFGEAVLNVENLAGRTHPFTRFVIEDARQVDEWHYDTSLEAAIARQASPPPPYDMPMFRQTLGHK